MPILSAVILAIIQGLTEFLPVSSSGHLVIAQHLMGFTKPPLFFDIVLHVGTLAAVIFFFWKQIISYTLKKWLLVGVATIPAGLFAVFFNDWIEASFADMHLLSLGYFVTGGLLLMQTRLKTDNNKPVTPVRALIMGLFQALAITPSISRSGSTVVGGLLTGLSREEAFSFSFIMSIPAILGAVVLEVNDVNFAEFDLISAGVGMFIAAIVGFASLSAFRLVIQKAKLHWFGYYCFILGIIIWLLLQ